MRTKLCETHVSLVGTWQMAQPQTGHWQILRCVRVQLKLQPARCTHTGADIATHGAVGGSYVG
eukprot:807444-Prymnesium_polylepis.1